MDYKCCRFRNTQPRLDPRAVQYGSLEEVRGLLDFEVFERMPGNLR